MTDKISIEKADILAVDLFSEKVCADIIREADGSGLWEPAMIHGGREGDDVRWVADPSVRNATIIPIGSLPMAGREFERAMKETIIPIVNDRWKNDLRDQKGAHLVRYTEGGHYEVHSDTGPDLEDRFFSVVCYLNDGFKGGSTYFYNLDHDVIPRRGKAVIFPSEYLHQAQPVVRGVKYVLVTWIVGEPPQQWI